MKNKISIFATVGALLVAGLLPTSVSTATTPAQSSLAYTYLPSSASTVKTRTLKRVKKPKRLARYHTGARIRWSWQKNAKSYQIQFSTTKKFKKKTTKRFTVANPRRSPRKGRVERSFHGLKNATTYHVRARAVSGKTKGKWSKVRKVKTKVRRPDRIKSVSVTPGPKPGEVTLKWSHKKKTATHYVVDMALSIFHPDGKTGPKRGYKHVRVRVPAKGKSRLTLTAEQLERAGVTSTNGAYLYYRFSAINRGTAGSKTRVYPRVHMALPRGADIQRTATLMRIGTYNVASAQSTATIKGKTWLERADKVGARIASSGAAVVGLQELSPGDASGKGSGNSGTSQAESLESAIRQHQNSSQDWRIARKTGFTAPGVAKSTQGGRIAYDNSKVRMISKCVDTEGNRNWSDSCTVTLTNPHNPSRDRIGSYGLFEDRKTKARFWVVSVHLESQKTKEGDSARHYQAQQVVQLVNRLTAEADHPVMIAGDLNAWQGTDVKRYPSGVITASGFTDTISAPRVIGGDYPTSNGWKKPKPRIGGLPARIDYLLVKDMSVVRYENLHRGANEASDHNMLIADVYIP